MTCYDLPGLSGRVLFDSLRKPGSQTIGGAQPSFEREPPSYPTSLSPLQYLQTSSAKPTSSAHQLPNLDLLDSISLQTGLIDVKTIHAYTDKKYQLCTKTGRLGRLWCRLRSRVTSSIPLCRLNVHGSAEASQTSHRDNLGFLMRSKYAVNSCLLSKQKGFASDYLRYLGTYLMYSVPSYQVT